MIELTDVHKAFGSAKILQGLDLEVSQGETLVIIGRSGNGKSVTLRHIVGLLQPDAGQVVVFGQDMAKTTTKQLGDVRNRLGYLFQDGALLNWLTLEDNVALPLLETSRLPKAEVKERTQAALHKVELLEAATKLPSEISGGMRKRAGLARALVSRPDLLLYDEPTSGLDPISSNVINNLITNLKAELGVTQIVVTHDMSSAYSIADRIALLHEGRIISEGTPDEIRSSEDPSVAQFIHGHVQGPLSKTSGNEPSPTKDPKSC